MPAQIRVVGLGYDEAGWEERALVGHGPLYVRTRRHPAIDPIERSGIPIAGTFDEIYESAADIEDVYPAIAGALLAAARKHGKVTYAVPGATWVGERSVRVLQSLAAAADVNVAVSLTGRSFIDGMCFQFGIDPLEHGLAVIDAQDAGRIPFDGSVPLIVGHVHSRALLSDVKLTLLDVFPPAHTVYVATALGTREERVEEVALEDLDRGVETDHLTSLYVPPGGSGGELAAFVDVIQRLRAPGGCPWDAEQTHHSLLRHLLEETYETVDAIEALPPAAPRAEVAPDLYAHLEEELGDLLLQVVLHATLAREAGAFTIADVACSIREKIVRRHPHVFGDTTVAGAAEVMANWEVLKEAEKPHRESSLDGIPRHLPALSRAEKVGSRAARAGFEWPSLDAALEKVAEEAGEVREAATAEARSAEFGDLLLALVSVARHLGVDPEAALRQATATFEQRFRQVEASAGERLRDLDIADLQSLWQQTKRGV